jgi:hypothetical protein
MKKKEKIKKGQVKSPETKKRRKGRKKVELGAGENPKEVKIKSLNV